MGPLDLSGAPLWVSAAVFAVAAAVVWIVGGRLTRSVDAIADRTRVDQAFAGMLLLGGITSLPEAANILTSGSIGRPELGLNNLLGSAAINVLLLAIGDAFLGREAATGIVARPSVLMMGTLCMLVLILVAGAILLDDYAFARIGVSSLVICAASLGAFWVATGYDRRSPWSVSGEAVRRAPTAAGDEAAVPVSTLWSRTAAYGGLIFAAGYALSQAGDSIAVQTGLGSAMVGFALIGIATSLPELSTIVTALRLRRAELAFGQVLGTNFINLSFFLPSDLVYRGGPVTERLGTFEIVSALLGAMLIGIFMVGLLEHRDRTILRMGYDSLAVILIFIAGLALLATLI
ncbi:sodium:calcium antiporter [Sphingosinicella sp. CPCC 101087]|uniref:sodium:calcium antiporter n=1 Tax=Sphingosinicella sp. CPCC 101087 TaxID=2497754 RepID=UPI00101CEE64|nr:sodium:calcium antiporter [Sphingosinicella sp. CPCC 101087]